MPGAAMTSFLPWAFAGALKPAVAVTANASDRTVAILEIMAFSLDRRDGSPSRFLQMELGLAGLAHQRSPYPLAQLGEARQAQRVARARPRQIDRDGLVHAARPSFED